MSTGKDSAGEDPRVNQRGWDLLMDRVWKIRGDSKVIGRSGPKTAVTMQCDVGTAGRGQNDQSLMDRDT